MEDKKYNYSIHWTQSYDNWIPSKQWIEEALESIVEHSLEDSTYKEANEVINRIRSL